jgi:cyclic pyranopterin phosphate synthase
MNKLTHINKYGEANMVDVSSKEETNRVASAYGKIELNKKTMDAVIGNNIKKGDVLGTARIAGIQGAKQCSNLIPLCHPLMISKVNVDIDINEKTNTIEVISTVKVSGKTGVEMEALTATSITLLTIYDMCKAMDKKMIISDIKVLSKSGGKSGDYKIDK